jgi:hypothetical protein
VATIREREDSKYMYERGGWRKIFVVAQLRQMKNPYPNSSIFKVSHCFLSMLISRTYSNVKGKSRVNLIKANE